MPFSPENLGVSEAGLPLLRELIHQRTGLFYENGRGELLSDRLAPLVVARGFRSFLDFYYLLKFDDRSADTAWRDVMDALSVQETYFWREADQLQALTCHVLPELLRATPGATVRIWSIPCATGEEPLTIAMALEEAGWFDRARIEIHASDGSPAAIAKAHAGLYRERSFRSLPWHLRDKYFEPRGTQWAPTASLQRRITSWSGGQPDGARRGADARAQPNRLLPQRIHLFLARKREAGRQDVRGRHAGARVSVRRRVRIAIQVVRSFPPRGRRSGVRLHQAMTKKD